MKQIKIIGIGMGDEASMTVAARDWIRESDLLIGAARMVRAAAAVSVRNENKCTADIADGGKNTAGATAMPESLRNIFLNKKSVIAWQPKDVWNAVRQSSAEKIAVLMSGDIGFFSGAAALREELESQLLQKSADTSFCECKKGVHTERGKNAGNGTDDAKDADDVDDVNDTGACEYEISWLPGISSMAYFCGEVGIPYEDAYMLSIHGRSGPYIRQIAVHEKTFLLTDGDLPGLGAKLVEYGLKNVTVWVGMDLAAPAEQDFERTEKAVPAQQDFKMTPKDEPAQRIFKTTPEELAHFPKEDCRPLTVCMILNPTAEHWRSPYRRDEEFCRDGKTPMTKEEVRGIILGKLMPAEGDIIYDIGGGSGSVSVACAIAASGGIVCSIECDADAAKLIDENRRRFACDNIEVIRGRAPEALRGLPVPDRVFIGGSGGELKAILSELEMILGLSRKSADDLKNNSERKAARVVISSVTLETNAAVSSYTDASPYVKNSEVCQLAVTKSKKVGGSTLMMAQNPVTVFSFDLASEG